MSDEYASKTDLELVIKLISESNKAMNERTEKNEEQNKLTLSAIAESIKVTSNLAIKVEHQSSLIEASEKRNDKRIDKLELEAKEDRKSASASRKDMHKEISDLSERVIPTELMTKTVTTLSNKIIGTLVVLFVTGGVTAFILIRESGADP